MRWIFAIAATLLLGIYMSDQMTPSAMADLTPSSQPQRAPDEAGADVAGLKDSLEKGLRARLPQDFVFIAKVVALVQNDQLPRSVVIGTFHWVRKNRSQKRYLMPYFEQVLRSRAAQLGVTIL